MKKYIIGIFFLIGATVTMSQTDTHPSKRAQIQDKVIESIIMHHPEALNKNIFTSRAYKHDRSSKDVQAFSEFKFQLDSIQTEYDETGNGNFLDLFKYKFEYEDDLFISMTLFFLNEESMSLEEIIKTDFKYNDANQLVEIIYFEPDEITREWTATWKDEFTNGPHGILQILVYRFDPTSGIWLKADKTQYVYHSTTGKEIICTEQVWDEATSSWINTRKYETNYYAHGNISQEKAHSWHDMLMNWELDWFFEYSYYPNGLLKEKLYVDVTGTHWFSEWKSTYDYKPDGDLKVEYYLEWNDQLVDFEFVSKGEYFYNLNTSLNSEISYIYNSANKTWVFEFKAEYQYDDRYTDSDLLLPEYIIGDGFDRDIRFRFMLTDIHQYEWDDTIASWHLFDKTNLFYSDLSTSNQSVNQSLLTIYPNPTNSIVEINYEGSFTGKSLLNLFDAQGRHVWTAVVETMSTIDLSELPSGVYNGVITSDNQVACFRVFRQ